MRGIFQPALEFPGYGQIKARVLAKEPVLVSGIGEGVQDYLAAALAEDMDRPILVVTANEVSARAVMENMQFYHPSQTAFFPAKDPLFYSADVRGGAIEEQRLKAIHAIHEHKAKVLVVPVEALFDRLVPHAVFHDFTIFKKVGQELPPEELAERLVHMGYSRRDQVEHAGQFSIRGGVIDIYPLTEDTAYRVELWGDEIDSIRVLDTETQRSAHRLTEMRIEPAREIIADSETERAGLERIQKETEETAARFQKRGKAEEAQRIREMTDSFLYRMDGARSRTLDAHIGYFYKETECILQYMPENTLLILEEPARIREKVRTFQEEIAQSIQGRLEKGYLLPGQCELFPDFVEVTRVMQQYAGVYMCGLLAANQQMFPVKEIVRMQSRSVNVLMNEQQELIRDLRDYTQKGYRVLLLTESSLRIPMVISYLQEEEIPVRGSDKAEEAPPPGIVTVMKGQLRHGFVCPEGKFVLAVQQESAARQKKKKRRRKFKEGQKIGTFSELTVGDYVVHETHGVGIYQGIVQLDSDDACRDYFKILYRDGGVLYVPTTSLDMLQRYVGGEDAKPKVNRLGGQEWQRAKNKVKESVAKLAEDLIQLYAEREARQGFAFSKDSVWQREFEESFPYEETEDQLNAIEDTKHDMESHKIMDRLICGDVGYGKTEIAIRAAFKAVQDGKQVAILAPTTILAQQHYNTFTARMREYPVHIDLLSRFRTKKQIAEALRGAAAGTVDILIGTHRILSKDVKFKDLGLLIVDEEQRFGVSHKEKIKALQKDVDVLTLTATPIPRTLHMSMSGIRDMSVLEEPPQERHPIQTFVMEEDEELIREAIYREIGRGGQVFFLSNRVQNIEQQMLRVQKLAPEARVSFAHGQMSERELENVMMEFVEGEIDVLVCTTIIETGLDIPNANTILIADADTMGLAQLYQLRGRVGRSDRLAYAYFMYPKNKVLKEVAQKRLEAIGEFTEFGSGFRIAMRDLEIRGAGNILGAEQHGHMGAVGYELYCKLLREAMEQLKNTPVRPTFETTMRIGVDAYIPSTYISNEAQKLEVYKKIAAITNEEEYLEMQEELLDRYSDMPAPVGNLVDISFLKALANELGADSLEEDGKELRLHFRKDAPLDLEKLLKLVPQMGKGARILPKEDTLRIILPFPVEKKEKDSIRLTRIRKVLEQLGKARQEGAAEHENP